MAASKSLPRVIPVTIFEGTEDERVVDVRKLPLGRASRLAIAFRSLPQKAKTLWDNPEVQRLIKHGEDDLPLQQFAMQLVQYLPEVLEVAADAVIDILAVGTGLERKVLEEVGLDEASDLFLAIITVNDLGRIQRNIKAAVSRLGISLAAPDRMNTSKTLSTPLPTPMDGVKTKS